MLEAFKPFAQEMPMFLLRLALVDYTGNSGDEGLKYQKVAEELSFFYARYIDLLGL